MIRFSQECERVKQKTSILDKTQLTFGEYGTDKCTFEFCG